MTSRKNGVVNNPIAEVEPCPNGEAVAKAENIRPIINSTRWVTGKLLNTFITPSNKSGRPTQPEKQIASTVCSRPPFITRPDRKTATANTPAEASDATATLEHGPGVGVESLIA